MNIAYVLDTYPSLTETFIAREIDALRRRGFDVRVFALHAGDGAAPIPLPPAMRVRGALEKLRSPARPKYFRALGAQWWRAQSSDLLGDVQHIHAGWASYPALIAWGAAQVAGVPWSFSGHARDLFVDGALLPEKLRAAAFAAVCTRAGQRLLCARAPAFSSKVLFAPHGIEVARYPFVAPRTAREADAPLKILGIGRLVEKKGFAFLLDAAARLRKRGVSARVMLIGDGPLRAQLQQRAARLNITDSVSFVGAKSHDEVLSAMREADCLVQPSVMARDGDRDGLPNVLLEAAAVGLPIVATRTGGITDFLDESSGYLCDAQSAASLADALCELRQSPETSAALCQAARRRVEELFDIEINIARLAEAFEQSARRRDGEE